jgi:class 3 adenylate cyclase
VISSGDLRKEVDSIVKSGWTVEVADKVPAPEDIRLNQNHAKKLSGAVVLYADLDGSTNMVDTYGWEFSAEMYKAYLRCASQIIKEHGGNITSYDGDRVMAIFHGGYPNNAAVHAAFNINYAVEEVIRPAYKAFYTSNKGSFFLKHVVGVDSGDLHAVRIGVRNDNDITWVGSAANYAAKLCAKSEKAIWISSAVYGVLLDENKLAGTGGNMWTMEWWNNRLIYGTHYRRPF